MTDTPITLAPDYKPKISETYMNPKHVEYFRLKLLQWRSELMGESEVTLHHLQEDEHPEADMADRATAETTMTFELRTRDRERKLISKIDDALARIEDRSYGFCEETGDPIGLARLEARPIATLCIDAQELHERKERTVRDERVDI